MKINYNIFWVEDRPIEMSVHIQKLKQILTRKYLIANGLDSPFTSCQDFIDYISEKGSEGFATIDLILIDFNLSDKNKTGIDIIELLRSKNIYTDIVFYSGNMAGAFKLMEAKTENLDNVTYSDNSLANFINKVDRIIEKQMNTIMQISDLRGYLMDSTSDFDFITRCYVKQNFSKLESVDQERVIEEVKRRVNAQKVNENNKFNVFENNTDFNEIVNTAMDSLEYVMTVKDKIYIMAFIDQLLNNREVTYAKNFAKKYFETIVQKRNKLAHNKLLYGKQTDHIKIANDMGDLECDCNNCKSKITYSECKKLRKDIFEYYNLFANLFAELNGGE